LHFALSFTTGAFCDTISSKSFQAREGESDPFISMEKGSDAVIDPVGHKSPVWNKDKD